MVLLKQKSSFLSNVTQKRAFLFKTKVKKLFLEHFCSQTSKNALKRAFLLKNSIKML
jgi:hypothetical protein